jgi:cell division protein FtsL
MLDRKNLRVWTRCPRRPRFGTTLLLWAGGFALVILFVWEQASVDRILVRLETARQTHNDLQTKVSSLSLEANRLSSLVQVESRAREELGLRRPATDEIVQLDFEAPDLQNQHFALGTIVPDANAAVRPEDDPR